MSRVLKQFRATGPKYLQGPSAVSGGPKGGYKIWKNISLFVAVPAMSLCMLYCFLKHKIPEEKHEFVPYEHLRIRKKRFPWGDGEKSLLHNPRVNALPTGYEN